MTAYGGRAIQSGRLAAADPGGNGPSFGRLAAEEFLLHVSPGADAPVVDHGEAAQVRLHAVVADIAIPHL